MVAVVICEIRPTPEELERVGWEGAQCGLMHPTPSLPGFHTNNYLVWEDDGTIIMVRSAFDDWYGDPL